MKLVLQIAAGIFLAGFFSWLFWIGVIAGAVASAPEIPKIQVKAFPQAPRAAYGPTVTYGPTTTQPQAPRPVDCANYVQMQGGEKHCLDSKRH